MGSTAQDEKDLVKRVKAKLDKVSDYTAAGVMKIDVSFINAPSSKVAVYYKKPNRFKVKKAGGISILPKGGVSINVNSLLLNDKFEAFFAGNDVVKGTPVKKVKLIPLDETSDVVITTLYIDEKTELIRKTSITTRESGSYEMQLDYGKYSTYGLPDKVVFTFNTKDYKLPKGITLEYDKGESRQKKEAKAANKKGTVEITYSSYAINKGVDDKVFND
jgi:outer membrane lipoprotein-sorting protein